MPLPHLHCDCSRVSPKANDGSRTILAHCRNIGHYPGRSLPEMVQNVNWRRGRREEEKMEPKLGGGGGGGGGGGLASRSCKNHVETSSNC